MEARTTARHRLATLAALAALAVITAVPANAGEVVGSGIDFDLELVQPPGTTTTVEAVVTVRSMGGLPFDGNVLVAVSGGDSAKIERVTTSTMQILRVPFTATELNVRSCATLSGTVSAGGSDTIGVQQQDCTSKTLAVRLAPPRAVAPPTFATGVQMPTIRR